MRFVKLNISIEWKYAPIHVILMICSHNVIANPTKTFGSSIYRTIMFKVSVHDKHFYLNVAWHCYQCSTVCTQKNTPPNLRNRPSSLGLKVRSIQGVFWNPGFLNLNPNVTHPKKSGQIWRPMYKVLPYKVSTSYKLVPHKLYWSRSSFELRTSVVWTL